MERGTVGATHSRGCREPGSAGAPGLEAKEPRLKPGGRGVEAQIRGYCPPGSPGCRRSEHSSIHIFNRAYRVPQVRLVSSVLGRTVN